MSQIDDIMNLAVSQLGYTEEPNGYNKYNLEYYGKNSASPWCVVFIWWLYKHTNLSDLFYGGGKMNGCGRLWDWYEKNQPDCIVRDKKPQKGDMVMFTFGGQPHCHIGMCESYDGKYIVSIDGNTSEVGSQDDGGHVLRRKRGKACIWGVIRPRYNEQPVPEEVWYTVKKGDTLSKIGKMYGVPWKQIAALNNIVSPYTIYPGQKLRIK